MIIRMNSFASPKALEAVRRRVSCLGIALVEIADQLGTRFVLLGKYQQALEREFDGVSGIDDIVATPSGHCLTHRAVRPDGTSIDVGATTIGTGTPTVIAGPCAVESIDQMRQSAEALCELGVSIMRAGAFKPRTSPYDFQGLGEKGLRIIEQVRAETGRAMVTEATGVGCFDDVESVADIVQIGARNMQNVELLQRAGRSSRPILLKRHFSATIDELLHAAEYIMAAGNHDVILCERGFRSFTNHSRFTLDISAIPVLRSRTHLPVIVDPSHAAGARALVIPLAKAALATGADGLIVEAHPCPDESACDAQQAVDFDDLEALMQDLECEPAIVSTMGGTA